MKAFLVSMLMGVALAVCFTGCSSEEASDEETTETPEGPPPTMPR
jgi:PBP1b-binding outer membrane lipoprotein LpoB